MISHSPKYLKIKNQYVAVEGAASFYVIAKEHKEGFSPAVVKNTYRGETRPMFSECYFLSDEVFYTDDLCLKEAERLFRSAIEEGF